MLQWTRFWKFRLTDWQKIDAINTFTLSKLKYHLSTSALNTTWASKLDADIRKKIKRSWSRLYPPSVC